MASYKLVFIVPLFTEHKPCYSEEESHPFRPALKPLTTHQPVPQQSVHFKSTKGSTDDLDDSLASDNTYDALSHKQKSKAIGKQMQEEMTADLQTKCPLSHAVSTLCDHNGGVLTNEHGDLKLTIPKGAIKEGDVVTFSIASDLYGPFVLPSKCQTDLVSPYYWIGVGITGSYHFHTKVQVEFEHFAVVTACDPSHYQLLSCEDDDESYTMRPVDYELEFNTHGDLSLCAFKTKHFCSYCLYHGCNDPMVSRVAALYLKPDDYHYLTYFTVEVWFSFHISHCLNTNKVHYKKKRMVLYDSHSFEISCEESSTSYFTLNYNDNFNGWEIDHSKSTKIKASEINFYNYYTNTAALKESEESSLFPPRFAVNVVRKPECTKDLSTVIKITLCEVEKPDETIQFKLYVSISASLIKKQDNSLLLVNPAHICKQNKPKLRDLQPYSTEILSEWKGIALKLGIPKNEISVIDYNHRDHVEDKCFEVLKTWLERTISPCWCHFTQALKEVRLYEVAQETQKHIERSHDSDSVNVAPSDIYEAHMEYRNTHLEQSSSGPSLDTGQNNGNKNDITLDLKQLMMFLKDLPKNKLMFFASKLLHNDVITDIRRNGELTIESICKAFVKEDPEASWMKVSLALEQAECNELAKVIHACFC